jgi:hypothetical protein
MSESDANDPNTIFAASTLELSFLTVRFIFPMPFQVRERDPAGFAGALVATRQSITTNESTGFYTRLTMGDPDIPLSWIPRYVRI